MEAFGERMPPQVRKALRLPRLDHTSDDAHVDVARITLAGMAMIVGRPIDPGEDIDPLSPVVQEVVDVAAVRAGDQFAAAFTPWLDRAISADSALAFADFADAFSDLDGAAGAIEAVERDPVRHRRAASEIAHDYLSYDVVLGDVLDHMGLGHGRRPHAAGWRRGPSPSSCSSPAASRPGRRAR